jgi:hypothetical protein
LGIEDSRPVLSLEVGLVVNINLNLNNASLSLDRVDRNSDGVKKSSNELSKSSWAPRDYLSSLKVELGSKNGIGDGSVLVNLSERKGLVDRGALISEGVDGSLRVDGNADGEASGNSRSGRSGLWEVGGGDAWNVLKLRFSLGSVEGGGGSLLLNSWVH